MLVILYKLKSYIHLLEIVELCFKYSFACLFPLSNGLLKIWEIYCVFASPPSSRRMCPPHTHTEGARPFKAQHQSDSFFSHTGWPLLWAKTIPNHTYHNISHTHRIHFQIDIGLILLFFVKPSFCIVLVSVSGVRCEHPLQSKPKKHHFSQVIIRKRQLHTRKPSPAHFPQTQSETTPV